MRKSNHGPFPHFIWSPDLKDAVLEQYVPVDPEVSLVKIFFHKILFEGYIKTDEDKNVEAQKTPIEKV